MHVLQPRLVQIVNDNNCCHFVGDSLAKNQLFPNISRHSSYLCVSRYMSLTRATCLNLSSAAPKSSGCLSRPQWTSFECSLIGQKVTIWWGNVDNLLLANTSNMAADAYLMLWGVGLAGGGVLFTRFHGWPGRRETDQAPKSYLLLLSWDPPIGEGQRVFPQRQTISVILLNKIITCF